MEREDPDYATKSEVARFLGMKDNDGLYEGALNTGHLKRIRRGPHWTRWYWAQVEAHKRVELLEGECAGKCLAVFAELEAAVGPLRLVGGKKK